jgi:polyhydroxybutyrate depolymerase
MSLRYWTALSLGVLLLLQVAVCLASESVPSPNLQSSQCKQRIVHHAVIYQGDTRSFSVYLPKETDNSCEPLPVIFAFHGVLMNGQTMAEMTDLHELGARCGFIVVYPDGSGHGRFRTWNAGGRSGRLERVAEDDVGFVRAMLRIVQSKYSVDPDRIHATGFSNGAMMCYRLAVELPNVFASIAPVAGTLAVPATPSPIASTSPIATAPSMLTRAVPSLHIHGTEDKFVPWDGPNARTPKNLDFCSVQQTVAAWTRLHATTYNTSILCNTLPCSDRVQDGTHIDIQSYQIESSVIDNPAGEDIATKSELASTTSTPSPIAIQLVRVHGGGHTWPGGKNREWLVGTTSKEFSANERMWKFFQEHPRK